MTRFVTKGMGCRAGVTSYLSEGLIYLLICFVKKDDPALEERMVKPRRVLAFDPEGSAMTSSIAMLVKLAGPSADSTRPPLRAPSFLLPLTHRFILLLSQTETSGSTGLLSILAGRRGADADLHVSGESGMTK
jgi:hypothetical protein